MVSREAGRAVTEPAEDKNPQVQRGAGRVGQDIG